MITCNVSVSYRIEAITSVSGKVEAATGGVLCKKSYSREIPVLESLSEKFFKKRPLHRCFPVNIAKFLRNN